MKNLINTKELAEFLGEANKNTYANGDALRAASLRLKSEDYHFEKNDLIYHDTYFGGRDFMGEEIVYKNQIPMWGMNYFGFIIDEKVSEKEVYDFLRKALMQECEDIIPVRGPSNFSDDGKEYRFVADGDLENFSGKEEILFNGKVIYRCLVHGGFIR
ncbi:XRE family transcriptional regulator [Patescibacteria group bacterium]|nr:MAG: XRE family transcriptional regulator [Patescibacteria group bacterium]